MPARVYVSSNAHISMLPSTRVWPTLSLLIRDYIESLATILNSHERRAVELMAEGYTPDEMARELGIKTPSATQLRYRIIAKLRRHYKTENKNNKQ